MVRYLYCDDSGDGGIKAQGVFLVDPCQANNTPLKTQTILPTDIVLLSTPPSGNAAAAVFTARAGTNGANSYVILEDCSFYGNRVVSPANTINTVTVEARNLAKSLALQSDSTGGTSTLTISASVDNTNYLTLDSIVTAAVNTKQYVEATVGAALALSPLAFKFIKISAGAAGVGIANTLTIAVK